MRSLPDQPANNCCGSTGEGHRAAAATMMRTSACAAHDSQDAVRARQIPRPAVCSCSMCMLLISHRLIRQTFVLVCFFPEQEKKGENPGPEAAEIGPHKARQERQKRMLRSPGNEAVEGEHAETQNAYQVGPQQQRLQPLELARDACLPEAGDGKLLFEISLRGLRALEKRVQPKERHHIPGPEPGRADGTRSEEHTSELQS